MAPRVDLVGRRFGRLVVRGLEGRAPKRAVYLWRCICDCGRETVVYGSNLQQGYTTSCGQHRDLVRGPNPKHGHCLSAGYTPTWGSWQAMRQRCSNPKHHKFAAYGGRGIKVCKRWAEFENFLADMGERPEGHTLDRINSDGPYSPENCRWATHSEQNRNRRKRQIQHAA
jgi:hypothetical protein